MIKNCLKMSLSKGFKRFKKNAVRIEKNLLLTRCKYIVNQMLMFCLKKRGFAIRKTRGDFKSLHLF